jgi:murein DD-endopeptidase MepM/ murein hydrolase activator NlpD
MKHVVPGSSAVKHVVHWLCAALMVVGVAFAASYTVKPGDTLSSIARVFHVSVAELRQLNNLRSDALEPGQVLRLPVGASASSRSQGVPLVTVRSQTSSLSVTHRRSCIPGDPVLVRVSGATNTPVVSWGNEILVMTRVGTDWLGVGREILGTKPTTVKISVVDGAETLNSSLKLLADPQPVVNVFMSQQVLSTLTDQNRMRERNMLNTAYSKSMQNPKVWTKAFTLPINKGSVSPFAQARFYQKDDIVNYHYGEDYIGRTGDAIRAVNDGTVVIAGMYPIRGGLSVIDHGAGITSAYFHQSAILVKVGQRVTRGSVIGRVGSTGFATGPHLHLEMRVSGEATDPKQWMGRVWPQ